MRKTNYLFTFLVPENKDSNGFIERFAKQKRQGLQMHLTTVKEKEDSKINLEKNDSRPEEKLTYFLPKFTVGEFLHHALAAWFRHNSPRASCVRIAIIHVLASCQIQITQLDSLSGAATDHVLVE
ncbi:hypothetical protein CEXT_328351 [Caerostris extrusa]|uniref:Uncharacterized protein n=1 Tax=Caerostris extrusa TaxID=172846 RepID=A0AAV4W1V6_CAEEX|nr:hypothetical protein CEXT_328351 [Caerostris extrusa]